MKSTPIFLLFAWFVSASACKPSTTTIPAADPSSKVAITTKPTLGTRAGQAGAGTPLSATAGNALAAFAAGCFWGSENTFRHVNGVVATTVGYAGGHSDKPTYEEVCEHTTGHAETVLVEYDPKVVSYETLVETFLANHDPTTKNRQGPDVGDQYRSAAFYFTEEQRLTLWASIKREQADLVVPITTEVTAMPRFWMAEEYHQQYDEKTGRESCPLPRPRKKD
jgi:peptide-methionine (S)-S-oxide reductase